MRYRLLHPALSRLAFMPALTVLSRRMRLRAIRQFQEPPRPLALLVSALLDLRPTVSTADHPADRQDNHIHQFIWELPLLTRIA